MGGTMRFAVAGAISESEASKVAIHQTSCPELSPSTTINATGQAGVQLNVTAGPTEIVAFTEDVSSGQAAACGPVLSPEHDRPAVANRMTPSIRCVRVIRNPPLRSRADYSLQLTKKKRI
jgi:hypothetical protein